MNFFWRLDELWLIFLFSLGVLFSLHNVFWELYHGLVLFLHFFSKLGGVNALGEITKVIELRPTTSFHHFKAHLFG